MKLAIIADMHFDRTQNAAIPERRGELADILLLRTVHRLNRFIKPDAVLVAGDFIDKPASSDAIGMLAELKTVLDKLKCPYVAIPGNHDPAPDIFYSVFKRPEYFTDIGGVRIVSFPDDPEEPGYNASRRPENIRILEETRKNFSGPIISFQHVPLFPAGLAECPYNYTNSEDILKGMRSSGISFSFSGHYHKGFTDAKKDGISFTAAQALCEDPFRFIIVDIDKNGASSFEMHQLKNPEGLDLTDFHIHTDLAYCNENMNVAKVIALKKMMGLSNAAFSEHSGHLYYDKSIYYSGKYIYEDPEKACDNRFPLYFQRLEEAGNEMLRGIEIDNAAHGRAIITKEHFGAFKVRIGAVHQLSELMKPEFDRDAVISEFMIVMDNFIKSGINILAHPFRVFRRANLEIPSELFDPLSDMLKENNVAAEINFHTNEPPPEFFRLCIEKNIKISFGSDSHNLYEVGEFYPHIGLMKKIVPGSDFSSFLLRPEELS